jgi:tetraacyldisaccharide 4'-kinase
LNILSGLYGRLVERSRASYERHPERRRHLHAAVISVGNVAVGGSGKTPVVAALARILLEAGRRPAILSRGYKRRAASDGVVVVSDRERVLAPTASSGDEPQMLARALPGVPVLVSADRHMAGRLAEERFAADVCILDDGFQHWQLGRNVDLVLMSPDDLGGELLPFGRLREPLSAARAADAILVPGTSEDASRVKDALSHPTVFRVDVRYGEPALVTPYGAPASGARTAVAVAAIARPRRFFEGATAEGWDLRRTISHRDHHWFTARDVERAETAARETGAEVILTTAKDAVRLEGLVGPRWAFLPMHVTIEPADTFCDWLMSRLGMA